MLRALATMIVINLLFLSSLAWTLGRLQNPDFLVERSKDINLYGRLSEQLVKLLDQSDKPVLGLSAASQGEIIATAVPPEEFYLFLDQYLTATLGYLTGQKDDLTFHYPLTKTKERIESSATDRILADYYNLPDCRSIQLKDWRFDVELPVCQLPSSSTGQNDITRLANRLVENQLSSLPDEFSVTGPSDKLITARQVISKLTRLFQLVWLATALAVAGYLLVWRRKALFGLATACLTVAVVEVGFSLIAWDWLARTVNELIGGSGSAGLTITLIDLVATLMEVMKTIWGNLAIGFFGAGAGFLVLGVAYRFKKPISGAPSSAAIG